MKDKILHGGGGGGGCVNYVDGVRRWTECLFCEEISTFCLVLGSPKLSLKGTNETGFFSSPIDQLFPPSSFTSSNNRQHYYNHDHPYYNQ